MSVKFCQLYNYRINNNLNKYPSMNNSSSHKMSLNHYKLFISYKYPSMNDSSSHKMSLNDNNK